MLNVLKKEVLLRTLVIDNIANSSNNLILTGDFNIDLLKINSNGKFQEFYYDYLTSHNLIPNITLPTRLLLSKRSATIIDHTCIYTLEHTIQPFQLSRVS